MKTIATRITVTHNQWNRDFNRIHPDITTELKPRFLMVLKVIINLLLILLIQGFYLEPSINQVILNLLFPSNRHLFNQPRTRMDFAALINITGNQNQIFIHVF